MIDTETRANWRQHAKGRMETKDPNEKDGNNQIILQLLDDLDHQEADLRRLQEAMVKMMQENNEDFGFCISCHRDDGTHLPVCLLLTCQAALGTEVGK